jgi:phosphate transport system substrate-binding protein
MARTGFLVALALLVSGESFAATPLPAPPDVIRPPRDGTLEPYRPCAVAGSRTGSATTILSQLGPAWAAAFHGHEPAATIDLKPPFEPPQGQLNERLGQFLDGKSDFALLSRDLAPSDRMRFVTAHGYEPRRIPVAGGSWRRFGYLDAVAVVVNDANPVRGLSFAQLDAVFSRSRLRGHAPVATWDELGVPQWAGRPVHVVGGASWAAEDSARAIVMRERVLSLEGRRGEWRSDLSPDSGTEAQVPDLVAVDPLAIGFTGLGHVKPGTRAIALAEAEGAAFVAPGFEEVSHGRYPLARTVNLLLALPPRAEPDPVLAAFARFLLSRDGQAAVIADGPFLPLRGEQASKSLALLGTAARCQPTKSLPGSRHK